MSTQLKKHFFISLGLHLLILLVSWLWSNPFAEPDIKDYKVTYIQLSRGDGGDSLKASFKNTKNLPQSTLKEIKNANKENAQGNKGSDLDTVKGTKQDSIVNKYHNQNTGGKSINTTQKSTKQMSAVEKALAGIDQKLEQREVQETAAQSDNKNSGQSPDGGLRGTRTNPELVQYFSALKRKISKEWNFSKGDFKGQLVTKILVMIDARGNIISSRYKKKSGDGSFDSSAMRALRQSAPFPVPPSAIKREALTEGFLIEFNPYRVSGRI